MARDQPAPPRIPPRAIFFLGLLLGPILLVAAWLLLWRGKPAAPAAPPPAPAWRSDDPGPRDRPRPAAPPAAYVAAVDAAASAMGPAEAAAPPDAAAAAAAGELPHPHPITPTHVRIQRENNLIGALNGAMDVNDGIALRGLLEQYRNEFPDDPNLLQEGYRIIADCIQRPGEAATAAGQRYFDRERGSLLRRFVARHCQLP